jgi:hypothetical protein
MGVAIDTDRFEERDYETFRHKLAANLVALSSLLSRPGFGLGPMTIGAELELDLVDGDGEPWLASREILSTLSRDAFTFEMNRFNLECNAAPCPLVGRPFTALARDLAARVAEVDLAARRRGGRAVTIGILPTLRPEHFKAGVATSMPRFRAMNAGLRRLRGGPFRVNIEGVDKLQLDTRDVFLEGANTSFQLHLRVSPAAFDDTYNAAQLATCAVLAGAGNSPIFLGHRLWDETRIALFSQATDDRARDDASGRPPRASFGRGWLTGGAAVLFARVAEHPPLLPVVDQQDPLEAVARGDTPTLFELRLAQSTVWTWNRPVYDPTGHLRIELRALPAGPTVKDMVANAAFVLGLTLGLVPSMPAIVRDLPFSLVEAGFLHAARVGPDAIVAWPQDRGGFTQVPVRALWPRLLALAARGLHSAGVDPAEAREHLGVFAERALTGKTGARWLAEGFPSGEDARVGLARRLDAYAALSAEGHPVARWPSVVPWSPGAVA